MNEVLSPVDSGLGTPPPRSVFVAGHRGAVGSSIVRQLLAAGYAPERIITRTRSELDLTHQAAVRSFFDREQPEQVYMAAAKVGGIHANNTQPAEFLFQNLMIEANVIHGAFLSGVKKLLFLGSSCIYPKLAAQPMAEEALLTAPLEPTNEPYAIAKIAGMKLCESYNRQYGQSHGIDYRSLMPTNLYGPGDNYHPENSHVVPALIRRFHEAKVQGHPTVELWGTGTPKREFLYVDDLASACLHVMNLSAERFRQHTLPRAQFLNVGFGKDISILALAQQVAQTVGYQGRLELNPQRPDGTPRKLLDCTRLQKLGWEPRVSLAEGLRLAYADFLKRYA